MESEDDEWDDEGTEYLSKLEEFVPGDMSGTHAQKYYLYYTVFLGTSLENVNQSEARKPCFLDPNCLIG